MNARFLIAVIILLLPMLSFSTTVAQVASAYVEPQETYEMSKITVGGDDYWIITIDGVETFVIGDDTQIIQSKEQIANILIQNMKDTSGIDAKRKQIGELVNKFNESQYPERTACERITGVDALPCYDKETCMKACYRVPLCAMQIRDALVLAIRDWNSARQEVDKRLVAVKQKMQKLESENDYRELSLLLQNMSNAMEVMDANELYDYPYCEEMHPDYNSVKQAIELSNNNAAALSTISSINTRAEGIYNKMNERMNYWNTREKTYKEKYGQVIDKYEEIKKMYSSAGWKDNATESAISGAANYSEELREYSAKGEYKIAIKKADEYLVALAKLKSDLQTTDARYVVLKNKAGETLKNIENAKMKLNGTKYYENLTAYEKEVKDVLSAKVLKNEIGNLVNRMDEIDASVKNSVAEAVLNGESGNTTGTPGIQVGGGGGNPLCGIINAISSVLGFSVDFMGLCK